MRFLQSLNRTRYRANRALRRSQSRRLQQFALCESLEIRTLLNGSPAPTGYTPAQIQHAYGFDQIEFDGFKGDGTGQKIAIVDAFNDPNITSDLQAFDNALEPASAAELQGGGSRRK